MYIYIHIYICVCVYAYIYICAASHRVTSCHFISSHLISSHGATARHRLGFATRYRVIPCPQFISCHGATAPLTRTSGAVDERSSEAREFGKLPSGYYFPSHGYIWVIRILDCIVCVCLCLRVCELFLESREFQIFLEKCPLATTFLVTDRSESFGHWTELKVTTFNRISVSISALCCFSHLFFWWFQCLGVRGRRNVEIV